MHEGQAKTARSPATLKTSRRRPFEPYRQVLFQNRADGMHSHKPSQFRVDAGASLRYGVGKLAMAQGMPPILGTAGHPVLISITTAERIWEYVVGNGCREDHQHGLFVHIGIRTRRPPDGANLPRRTSGNRGGGHPVSDCGCRLCWDATRS